MTTDEQVDPVDLKMHRRRMVIVIWMCFGACLTIAAFVPQAREQVAATHSLANLKQIGLALLNYHDIHGSYPPAYIAGDDGRPAHSWRVLILPFIDNQPLYDQYDFRYPGTTNETGR
ncbi:MAG: DUF1559 domain-containing protein [Planctomycetaceae bacterium]